MKLPFRFTRKGVIWVGGVPSLGAVLYFVAGMALRIAPDAPPEFAPENMAVDVPVSTVFVPVDLQAAALANLVETTLKAKPLVSGTSTKLITEAVFGLIDLPADARRCNPVTVVERVIEEVPCKAFSGNILEDIGRVGECAWNNTGGRVMRVARDVVVNTVECTGLDQVIDEISPVPELAYSVNLRKLSISGAANGGFDIATTSTAHIQLQAQGRALRDFDWISAQKCSVPVRVKTRATISVAVKDDELFISPEIGPVSFDLDRGACSLGFFNHIDLDGLSALFKSGIGQALTPALRSALVGAVDSATEEPVASEAVAAALAQARTMLAAPIALPTTPPVWIGVNAQEMLVSPRVHAPDGRRDTVRVAGGFTSKPQLMLTEPPVSKTQVNVRVDNSNFGGFHVVPTAHVPLDVVEATANKAIQDFLAEKAPGLRFGDLSVRAYQNGQRLVLGIRLKGVSFLRVSVELYVTARPVFDKANNVIVLDDLKLDVESSEDVVRRVSWYAEGALEQALAPFMRFEVDSHFSEIINALSNLQVQTPDGSADLSVALNDLRLETFWLDDNTLNAAVSANGTAKVAVDLTLLP